jgi:uncharacterized protein (TIGR01777 family)
MTVRDNDLVRILATGTSGTIGAALMPALSQQHHAVTRLKTGAARGENEIHWEPLQPLHPQKVAGFDAVIHLAGENVFGRWSARKKAAIRDSRVLGTQNLCDALARSGTKPGVLIAASAVGYYGSRSGDLRLTEGSGSGEGFLAAVTREWEQATEPAKQAGWRVVNLRTGIVLTSHGGALSKMLTPFRLGLGGKIGSGRQWMSWIAIDDEVGGILHCLKTESVRGPVNLVAPHPASNAEFTRILAKTLHRPAFATVPAIAARAVFGREMADETVLASQQAYPEKLLASGYKFQHHELDEALRRLLTR